MQNKWLSNDSLRCTCIVALSLGARLLAMVLPPFCGSIGRDAQVKFIMSPHAGVKWKPGKEGRGCG